MALWIPVASAKWDDSWHRSLSLAGKVLWDYLITTERSYYGFIPLIPSDWTGATGLPLAKIIALLGEFEQAGKVVRDGEMLLVIRALKYRDQRPKERTCAMNSVRKRYEARYPRLVEIAISACLEKSQEISGNPLLQLQLQLQLQEQEQDSKNVLPSDAAHPTAKTRKRPPAELSRPRTPEPANYVALATELDYFIRTAIAKHNIAHGVLCNDPETCARELRLLIEKDGFSEDCIFPALVWAWDYEFPSRDGNGKVNYGSVLISIANWRPTKFGKMYTSWLQHTNGDLQEGAKIRRAIQNKLNPQEVTA